MTSYTHDTTTYEATITPTDDGRYFVSLYVTTPAGTGTPDGWDDYYDTLEQAREGAKGIIIDYLWEDGIIVTDSDITADITADDDDPRNAFAEESDKQAEAQQDTNRKPRHAQTIEPVDASPAPVMLVCHWCGYDAPSHLTRGIINGEEVPVAYCRSCWDEML